MSRFPIRTQVLMLGTVFVLQILVVAAISWGVQARLVDAIHYGHDITSQNRALSLLEERIERIAAGFLKFEHSSNDVLDEIREEIATLSTLVDEADDVFTRTDTEAAYRPHFVPEFQSVAEIAQTLVQPVDFLGSPGVTIFERDAIVSDTVLPALDEMRTTVDSLRDEIIEAFHVSERQTDVTVRDGNVILLGLNGFAVLLGLGCVLIFGRVLARPFQTAAQSVQSIADGALEHEITGQERGDEAGAIARNLAGLRDQLKKAEETDRRERVANERRVALFSALGEAMGQLAQGQVAERLDGAEWNDLGTDYKKICDDFNELAEQIGDMVGSLKDSAEMVQRNSQELSKMSNEMSRRSEVQAATLEESAAALEEMSGSVRSAADRAEAADRRAGEGRRRAEEGGTVMERALQAMSSIAASSDQITQIIGVIDDIAFQTNLLALNAGVEAARAGESGKGFSVVASEVRSLAQRASESAREIKALVQNSSQQVKDGGLLVEQTGATLSEIVGYVTEVSDMVGEIASAAKEQSAGLEEINVGVAELDKVTQQNAAMVGETSSASQQLSAEADRLSSVLNRFMGMEAPELEEVTPVAAPIAEIEVPEMAVQDVPVAPPKRAAGADMDLWEDF